MRQSMQAFRAQIFIVLAGSKIEKENEKNKTQIIPVPYWAENFTKSELFDLVTS